MKHRIVLLLLAALLLTFSAYAKHLVIVLRIDFAPEKKLVALSFAWV